MCSSDSYFRTQSHWLALRTQRTALHQPECVLQGASLSTICVVSYIDYCKISKYSDPLKLCCNHPETKKEVLQKRNGPKDASSVTNSEDHDQTAPRGAV